MREEITNGTLVLHRYKPEHVQLLYEAAMESKGGEFTRWMPWCHEDYKFGDSEGFISRTQESWADGTEYGFGIFEASSGDYLGGIGLNQFNSLHHFANLGYWVRTSRQNLGIASMATRLFAAAAFEDLPLNRIEILVAAENTASLRTAEKSGATFEGTLRGRLLIGNVLYDAAMYSFVRSDFLKS